MPEHEIKTRVSVDGEQGYRQAIKTARDQLKLLEAQLKQATSAMGRNASEEDKAAKKADTLRLKIEQQKKIIEQTQKALLQASQKYGENSAAAVQWQTRLANAQTVLNNMNNELDGLTNGLHESGDAFREAGESAGESAQQTANFAEGIKGLANVAKGVGNDIKGVFDQTLRNVRWVTDEVVSMINVATGQVDQWKGITDVYGGSAEGVQKWLYGTSAAGLKYSDTTGALSHFVQAVDSDAADAEDALKKLELVQSDYDYHWDFFIATLEKLNAYQGDDKGTLVTALFGKGNYAGIMTMLTKWDSMMVATQNAEEHNLFLGGDEIEQVDAFQEKVNLLLDTVTNLQTLLGKDFIINFGLNDLVEHATDTIISLANLFSAIGSGDEEAAKQATIELTANLQLLSTDLTNAINSLTTWVGSLGQSLKESDNPILQTIGGILESLSSTLSWLNEWLQDPANQQLVTDLFKFMLINKGVEVVSGKTATEWIAALVEKVALIYSAVQLISGVKGLSNVGNAASNAAVGGAAVGGSSFLSKAGVIAFIGGVATIGYKAFTSDTSEEDEKNLMTTQQADTDALYAVGGTQATKYRDEYRAWAVSQWGEDAYGKDHNKQDYDWFDGFVYDVTAWLGGDKDSRDQRREIVVDPVRYGMFMEQQDPWHYQMHNGELIYYDDNGVGVNAAGQGVPFDNNTFDYYMSKRGIQTVPTGEEKQDHTAQLWGSDPESMWTLFTYMAESYFDPAAESDLDRYTGYMEQVWPEMLDLWNQFIEQYSGEYGPDAMDEFMFRWLPATTMHGSDYYMPGGGYWGTYQTYDDLGPGGYAPWVPPGAGSGQVDLTDAAANKIAAAVSHMPIDMDGQRVANLVSQHMAANV